MNNERDLENNNAKFIYFFKNYKINNSDIDIKLDTGDENNFGNINKEEKVLESIEDKIKQKKKKITELYKALNDIYCTDGIVVPI